MATPSVPLSRSWQVFWSDLFPDEEPLSTTLSKWLRDDLVSLVVGKPAAELSDTEISEIPWLLELGIVSSPSGAVLNVGSHGLPNSAWFGDSLVETNDRWFGRSALPLPEAQGKSLRAPATTTELRIPRWRKEFGRQLPAQRHPEYFNPFQDLHAASDRNIKSRMEKCFALTHKLTRQIGADIEHELRFNLRVGRLTASARIRGEVQTLEGIQIVELFNEGMQIKVNHDLFESRHLTLTNAKIQLGPGLDSTIKMPLAFDDYDDAIFDRMKDLRDSKRARSVSEAAKLMAKFALAKSSKSNGVIRRLAENFGRKYPSIE